jgi:hypothetical protein
VPWYYEHGLVSDGDPAVAFGPKLASNGTFSWGAGSRLYYANLTSNFGATRADQAFKGFEAIAVSRTDNAASAAANNKAAWLPPVLVSKQNSTTFSDKEQVWADNASSSPFFGTVYVCWASFVGQEKGNAAPAPLKVAVSHDGGDTWTEHPITSAANNAQKNPMDGCTIRTDSHLGSDRLPVGPVEQRQSTRRVEARQIRQHRGNDFVRRMKMEISRSIGDRRRLRPSLAERASCGRGQQDDRNHEADALPPNYWSDYQGFGL